MSSHTEKMVDDLLRKLNAFSASDVNCRKVYCTTCGGLVSTVNSNMTPELRNQIIEYKSVATPNELCQMSEWGEYIGKFEG